MAGRQDPTSRSHPFCSRIGRYHCSLTFSFILYWCTLSTIQRWLHAVQKGSQWHWGSRLSKRRSPCYSLRYFRVWRYQQALLRFIQTALEMSRATKLSIFRVPTCWKAVEQVHIWQLGELLKFACAFENHGTNTTISQLETREGHSWNPRRTNSRSS